MAAAEAARMTRSEHLDLRAVALLLLCCMFWGLQQVLVKATIAEIPPVFQAAVRFTGATLILCVWCRFRRIALFAPDASLKPGLLAGALFAIEFALMYSALEYGEASRVTIFVYTAPFWVALLLPIAVKSERLCALQWAGLALAFLAIALSSADGFARVGSAHPWRGDLLALASGMAWGLTTVVIRSSALSRVSAEKLLFYQVAMSSLCLPMVSLLLGESWRWEWSAFAAFSIGLQTLVGAFASFLAWMWMLGRYPATRISAFVFLTPIFALIFGSIWLGEAVSVHLLLAIALVAAGIALVNRKPASGKKPRPCPLA